MPFLLKGLILGFSIAAPVGPIGLLCIRRTLSGGISSGFASGLGAATADAIYGAIAAFSLSVVTNFLLDHQRVLQAGGGLFLLYLGLTTFRSLPAETAATTPTRLPMPKAKMMGCTMASNSHCCALANTSLNQPSMVFSQSLCAAIQAA